MENENASEARVIVMAASVMAAALLAQKPWQSIKDEIIAQTFESCCKAVEAKLKQLHAG